MSIRPRHVRVAFAIVVIAALAAVAAAAIAFVTKAITGRVSPLPTIPPWDWSGTDIAQWFSNRATSDSVVNVVTQVLATILWIALVYVAWNVIRELIDQANHGVIDTRAPRTRQRSSTRRVRPAFASSFVALLLGASTITASTVGATGLPQRAPAVVVDADPVEAAAPLDTSTTPFEAVDDADLPAGMMWIDYTVTRADESLRSIAATASQDPGIARLIWTTNQHQTVAPGTAFNDPTIVKPGWTLRVPVPAGSVVASPAADQVDVVDAAPAAAHDETVVDGDTLYEMIDDVVDDPVTMTHVEAVSAGNDGVATPDGTFVFSASNPDLIHPGQVFDLQPAIDLDTIAAADTTVDVMEDLPAPVVPDGDTAPAETKPEIIEQGDVDQTATDTDTDSGGVVDTTTAADAPDAAGQPDRVRIDDPPAPLDPPAPAAEASPTPPVTSPAPPTPIPANSVDLPSAQPGDAAATPPPAPSTSNEAAGSIIPIGLLAAGGLGLAGLFIALDRRRRISRAQRPIGHTIAAPDPEVDRNEHIMRSAARLDRAMRVNLAIRQLGAQLAQRDAPLRCRYVLADATGVTVVFDRPIELDDGWIEGPVENSWVCTIGDDDLATFSTTASPWPALVPIGTLDTPTSAKGTDVLVDIEGLGALAITGPDSVIASVLSALVASLSSSPYADMLTLVDDSHIGLHGLDPHLQHRLAVDSVDALGKRLGDWIEPFDFDDQHLIAARHEFGAEYEPCIAAVVADLTDTQRKVLADLPFDGSRPIALVTTDTELATTVLNIDDDGIVEFDGQRIRCHRLDAAAATVVANLLDLADTPTISATNPIDEYRSLVEADLEPQEATDPVNDREPTPERSADEPVAAAPALEVVGVTNGVPSVPQQLFDTEPDVGWHVRNLGPLEIVHTNGTHLVSMRELFTMLAMHPGGLTGAEVTAKLTESKPSASKHSEKSDEHTAADDDDPHDSVTARRARFSDLRRALGHDDSLLGRTYLPVHSKARGYRVEGVRVDSERFIRCLESAKTATGNERINWLAGGLQLVRGQLNTGDLNRYEWASHIFTTLEANIIDTGIELAQLAAETGNWPLADWAASQVRVANPYDQRGLAIQVQARQALGDEVGIRRLHDEAVDTVDELEPDVHEVFNRALAR